MTKLSEYSREGYGSKKGCFANDDDDNDTNHSLKTYGEVEIKPHHS
jgi:hypothetical protein